MNPLMHLWSYLSELLAERMYTAIERRIPLHKKADARQAVSGLSTLLIFALAFLVYQAFQGSFKLAGLGIRTEAFRLAVQAHPYWVAVVLTSFVFALGALASSLKQKKPVRLWRYRGTFWDFI